MNVARFYADTAILTPAAVGVLLRCLVAAKDGAVPESFVRAMRAPRAVEELVGAGMVRPEAGTVQVLYAVPGEPEDAKLERARAQTRERVRKCRAKKSGVVHEVGPPASVTSSVTVTPNVTQCNATVTVTGNVTRPEAPPPSHTLPSPDISGDSGISESSSGTSEPSAKDLKASPRVKRRKPKTAIPADWTPSESHRAKCAERGIDCDAEATRFRTNAEGKDVRWVDWSKALHGWVDTRYAKAPAAVLEVPCPRDLAVTMRGELEGLSRELGAPLEAVRAAAIDFVRYWTVGAGKGTARAVEQWSARCRQRVLDQSARGQLLPPGALEHQRHGGRLDTPSAASDRTVAPSPWLAMIPRAG